MKKHIAVSIKSLNQPICCSTAVNNCTEAKNSQPEEAENLYNELFLATGAKVVLTRNLWSEAGLRIGSQGFVKYIIYGEDNEATADSMPDMLLVHFPGYRGPSYLTPEQDEDTVLPIHPVEAVWYNGRGEKMTRTQFPLHYGYDNMTLHRAQGKLEKYYLGN